ncbi:MAG: hypothetical protein ACE5IG_06105 [Dehalococcoidia bacterium]
MRLLSSSLLAAQQSASAHPFVQVKVEDRTTGVVRLRAEQLYQGSEPDYHHAVTMPGDGSLVRARVHPSTSYLYIQRVTNPGPTSDFSPWTFLNTVSPGANITLCSQGSEVRLFYIHNADRKSVWYRKSNDYGATWGSSTQAFSPALNKVLWIAAAFRPDGTVGLAYASDFPRVYFRTQAPGQYWDPSSTWPYSAASLSGLACTYFADWNLIITGEPYSGQYRVWSLVYGDGGQQPVGTWSSREELVVTSQGATMEFRTPFLAHPDIFRLFFVEKFSGAFSYSRPLWSHCLPSATFNQNLWREPTPLNLSTGYGVALASDASYLWLSTARGVWRSPLSPTTQDLSADLLELTLEEAPGGGAATLTLRNDDGRYNTVGPGTSTPVIQGSEVSISPGYITSGGAEVSAGPAYWIRGWTYRSGRGHALFTLHLDDAWTLLEHWRARRQYVWVQGQASVQQILTFILTRVGLSLEVVNASATFSTFEPEFTIHPGESGAQAVRRLLSMVPDVLFFRGATGLVRYPQESDATDYTYGTSHALLKGAYTSGAARYNRVQAYGSDLLAESFAWDEAETVYERLLQVHDLNLLTQGEAQDRADAVLARELRQGVPGEILVPANCGQELYDVVEVTDSGAGLTATPRRVLGSILRYSTGPRPQYTQRLQLGQK